MRGHTATLHAGFLCSERLFRMFLIKLQVEVHIKSGAVKIERLLSRKAPVMTEEE